MSERGGTGSLDPWVLRPEEPEISDSRILNKPVLGEKASELVKQAQVLHQV